MPCGKPSKLSRPPTASNVISNLPAQKQLELLLPPWQLSKEAWELLKKEDKEGYAAAQFLLKAFNEELEKTQAKTAKSCGEPRGKEWESDNK